MTQGNNWIPTTGVFSGLTATNDMNAALDALLTGNSGSSAPTNALGGVPKLGQIWIDTTVSTLPVKKSYTGSAWVVEAVMDVTNGLWLPIIGGGVGTIASGTTTDIGGQPQSCLNVTGTTTITSLGSTSAIGREKVLIFSGALTLTYNATSLIIPGAANRVTAAGDCLKAVYLGSGNWRVLSYTPITGTLVTGIDAQTGLFTTGNGIDSSGKVIELTAARRTLPTTQVFTTGSGTYTTPANVLWLELEMVGGGGGGAGSGSAGAGNGLGAGNTTFGTALLIANAGAGTSGQTAGGGGGTSSGGFLNKTGATGGGGGGAATASPGGAGGSSPFGGCGQPGAAGAGAGGSALANTGSGGGGGGVNTTANGGGGGGSGGYVRAIIQAPGATYLYAVGAAGGAGTAGTGGAAGGGGAAGYIQVTEHYGS